MTRKLLSVTTALLLSVSAAWAQTAIQEVTHNPEEAVGTVSMTYGDDNTPLTVGTTTLESVQGKKVAVTVAPAEGYKVVAVSMEKAAPEGAIRGKFSIDNTSDRYYFAKGNLQATTSDLGETWTWSFAEHQWDYLGSGGINTKLTGDGKATENGTVDLFNWVGASSSWTGNKASGLSCYTVIGYLGKMDGYGVVKSEALKNDWGNLPITNGGNTANSGWQTLDEKQWKYVLDTRNSGSTVNGIYNARWTLANINWDGDRTWGLILFPDGVTIKSEEASWGTINAASAYTSSCSTAQWAALEKKGCVFLPAAGERRTATTVSEAAKNNDARGYYWSKKSSDTNYAYYVFFKSGDINSNNETYRSYAHSVRLVRKVE